MAAEPGVGVRVGNPKSRETESIADALERARRHSQVALSEGVAAASALLDAASLSVSGGPAVANRSLSELARTLEQVSDVLAGKPGAVMPGPVRPLLDALDAEIRRWESRSKGDPDARAVLRAFLGLREVLWEIGLRPDEESPSPPEQDEGRGRRRENPPPRRPRVQRVEVDS